MTPIAASDGSRTLQFGSVGLGAAKTLPITVLNGGNEPLSVTPVLVTSSDAEFTVAFAPGAMLTVAPGATTNLNVTFSPVRDGEAKGTVTLATNSSSAPTQFTILLDGTGVTTALQICQETSGGESCDDTLPAGMDLQVDFGTHALGVAATAQLVLRVKGGVPI